ncbi:DUF2628 domain-containing protein [Pontibacillus yanchengensis]|uniref:Zinc-ribbon domain-containing protein n=1 Tax=Pontibacillus yanchengensis Y32 TaxID=1385514 RepID=A0A0A2TAY3_9BACI|nr:zinc ribbon domain-containing protein [Pontibacillus yanchengensis]KGP71578.1 hypothetical protein N782_18155 [Pontibacillus yanchengensis Y32]
MNCEYCGEYLQEGVKVCPACGRSVYKEQSEEEEPKDGEMTEQQALLYFVGDNSDIYRDRWGLDKGYVRTVSINFAALFLSLMWVSYRKMYTPLLVIVGIFFVLDAIVYGVGEGLIYYDNLIGLGTALGLGLFGNVLYYKEAKRKIAKLKEKKGALYKEDLAKAGGPSWLGVLFGIGVIIAYSVLSAFVFFSG